MSWRLRRLRVPPLARRGICRAEDLASRGFESRRDRERLVAVNLYPEVAAGGGPDRDRLLERILLHFPDRLGAFKRTQSQRFPAFDEAAATHIAALRLSDGSLRVHDLAVSDGRTAVDLFDVLNRLVGAGLSFLASDHAADVAAVSGGGTGDRVVVIVDYETHAPLQVIRCPFVFNVQRPEGLHAYPINRMLLAILLRTRVRSLLDRMREQDPTLRVENLRLLAPECLDLLARDPRFRFERYDLLFPHAGRFDVVRAMNVLNPGYFSEKDVGRAAANVHAGLSEDGLFLTGSNQDAGSVVDGAIYRRTASGFELLYRSGAGSPVHELVSRVAVGR